MLPRTRRVALGWIALGTIGWQAVSLYAAPPGAGEESASAARAASAARVPAVQVVPLPYQQASFQWRGDELTRYHFGPSLERPFWHPIAGPEGRSLTRMGHPRDPHSHRHHDSVWIAHENVGGVNFWANDTGAKIVCREVLEYDDGPASATMLSLNHWLAPGGKTLLIERRRATVESPGNPQSRDGWTLAVDMRFEPPGGDAVVLGQSGFGMMAVRMAKPIGVHDGGGRILNSAGQRNEREVFRKPARWVDYSGPITENASAGITLMDHPQNPGSPAPFHVRDDGWMGASLSLQGPITIAPGKPLRLRYALWVHGGVPDAAAIDAQWRRFARAALPEMTPSRK